MNITGEPGNTETAFEAWDRRWTTEAGRRDWLEPEPEVVRAAGLLESRPHASVLDLGCGVGRHALYLAGRGCNVHAADASPAALEMTRAAALRAGLTIGLRNTLMTSLPYADASFDYVLAWNVVYHGTLQVVRKSVAEIQRILVPGGLFQATLLSKRDSYYGRGNMIAEDTFVLDVADEEKRHPHFYCDRDGLGLLLRGFEIVEATEREQQRAGSFHWIFLARKR